MVCVRGVCVCCVCLLYVYVCVLVCVCTYLGSLRELRNRTSIHHVLQGAEALLHQVCKFITASNWKPNWCGDRVGFRHQLGFQFDSLTKAAWLINGLPYLSLCLGHTVYVQ